MSMHRNHAAFLAAMSRAGSRFERREVPDLRRLQETIDKIGEAFEARKKAEDERWAEMAKRGTSTPETDAKLAKIDAALNDLGETRKQLEALVTRAARPGLGGELDRGETPEARAYRSAFAGWMRRSRDPESITALNNAGKALEQRSTLAATTTGAAGGFALPEQIAAQIARLSVDISPIRQIARVVTVGTSDYKELFDTNGAAFEWVGETGTRSQTNTPDLAEVAPTFGTASARPRATEESLDDLFFDVENWLITSAAEAIAAGEGAAFVGGNGTNRPTGFLSGPTPVTTVDASRAFGTLQYVASGQAAALPTSADTMLDMVYSLRARYRANARWVAQKATLASVRKYKGTDGQYLWQPSLVVGQPDMFLGYPITEAEDMPSVAANAFPLAFGDFREGYLIADRVGMRITRDDITLPGFVQFYIRRRVGGRLRNTQAIKLLKIAAS